MATSFPKFGALPPMLQDQIWDEALAVPTVFSVISAHPTSDGVNTYQPPLSVAFVGPKPYLVGLSCQVARSRLDRTYGGPVHLRNDRAGTSGVYWVKFDSAVIYIGCSARTAAVLGSFSEYDVSRFKHVAIAWSGFQDLARACQRFATSCPALRTIIIQMRKSYYGADDGSTLDPETAAHYAAIATDNCPELECGALDDLPFRGLLPKYFGDSPPRLVVVDPESY